MVRFANGAEVTALAVVLSTGVAYTRLTAPGVDEFAGRGVYYGAASHEAVNAVGQDVYIVGAANSAGQAALHFSRYAGRVVMLVRGPDVRRSMSEYLVARIEDTDNIEVRTCTEIVAGTGTDHLTQLTLRTSTTGETEVVDATWCFVFIGASPRTEWLGDAFARDAKGFLCTGPTRTPCWRSSRPASSGCPPVAR